MHHGYFLLARTRNAITLLGRIRIFHTVSVEIEQCCVYRKQIGRGDGGFSRVVIERLEALVPVQYGPRNVDISNGRPRRNWRDLGQL